MQVYTSLAYLLAVRLWFRDTLQTIHISHKTLSAFSLLTSSLKNSSNLMLWFHQGILETLAARLEGGGEMLLTPPSRCLAGCSSGWKCC